MKPATKQDQVYSTALALLQEKKTVSVNQIYETLQTSSGLRVDVRDIHIFLSHLFELVGTGLQPLELRQALLFADAALGYWKSGYAILIVKQRSENAVRLYGIAAGASTGHLIGRSSDYVEAVGYLKNQGISISVWYPLSEYLRLLP